MIFHLGKNIGFDIFAEKHGKVELEERIKNELKVNIMHVILNKRVI